MTFGLRFTVIALAAFSVASAIGSLAVWWLMRRVRYGVDIGATALFQLRLAPAVLSAVVLFLAVVSFEQFEPRGVQEHTGLLLMLFAAIGGATLATMAARLATMARASARAVTAWMTSAEAITLPGVAIPAYRIDSSFPVVAIAGLFRPRLLIARSVLEACPPDELEAILAHERWHLRNGDNARRLLVAAAPDVLMWTPLSRRLAGLWQAAAEDAADAEAGLTHPTGRVSLAQALIRVGRLAPAGLTPTDLPASALFRGENLERRIRRLLDPPANFATHRESPSWLIVTAASLLVVSLFALQPIHELVEAVVAFLP